MALIALKCPNCGGSVELDDKREIGFCMYCGNKMIMQESIKQKVEIDNSRAFDNWIKLGLNAIVVENYQSAENYADRVLEHETENGMGWYLKACAAMSKNERVIEAYAYFEKAAKTMTNEEKKTNGVRFMQELSWSLSTEFSAYPSCSDLKFNNEALLIRVEKMNAVCSAYFDNLDDKDAVDILNGLYDASFAKKWTQCWEALSLIQNYLEQIFLLLPWGNEWKYAQLLIKTNSTLKERKKELPPCKASALDDDVINEVYRVAGTYARSSEERASAIKKIDNMKEGDNEFDGFMKRAEHESLAINYAPIYNELLVAQGKVLGRSGAVRKAAENLQNIWDYIIGLSRT